MKRINSGSNMGVSSGNEKINNERNFSTTKKLFKQILPFYRFLKQFIILYRQTFFIIFHLSLYFLNEFTFFVTGYGTFWLLWSILLKLLISRWVYSVPVKINSLYLRLFTKSWILFLIIHTKLVSASLAVGNYKLECFPSQELI